MSRRPALALLGLLVAGWAATAPAIVSQDEIGIVRRLGAMRAEPLSPGLHLLLPWPVDRLDRIKPGQTRTLAVGAPDPGGAPLTAAPDPEADDRLTGDLNLVSAQVLVQYRVADPARYLFGTASVDPALEAVTETALAEAFARRGVDDLLTTGRNELADHLAREIQKQSDLLGLGLTIRAVRLGRVAPPAPVSEAFADATRARSDKRQLITGAEEYRDRARAEARGSIVEIADRAAARQDRDLQLARGEADRFSKVLAEARSDRDATTRRLYLEALGELLPRFARKVVVQPGQEIDLGLFADEPPTRQTEAGATGPASSP